MSKKISVAFVGYSTVLLLFVLISCEGPNHINGLSPDWENIKINAMPLVALPDEFGTPHIQPHSTLAWEDGVFISGDGLHLYAFYAPADLLQYGQYVAEHPVCPDITPFLRGPQLGMDLSTNPWGCENILHSDIAYTSRSSTSDAFSPWQLSNIANPYRWDGAFQSIDNADGTIDAVVSAYGNLGDIFWARSTQHNPFFESFVAMPSPINTSAQEDNAHLERIDENMLVLLFDNHGVGDATTTIKYSISTDNGEIWSEPVELGGNINAGPHDIQGHLFNDGNDWWLYFVSARNGPLSIFRSKHNESINITRTFDSWGTDQLVIAPGIIKDNSGFIAAVGEPTLTEEGDISFVVVYATHEEDNPYDRFEIDPWFLPRIR